MKHLTTNVYGPMLCSQAFAKLYFAASKTAQEQGKTAAPGRIVNIASQAAHIALPMQSAYCASKAALLGLTRSMASEWADRGITANSVSPTVAWTALAVKAWGDESVREAFQKAIPTGRFAQPDEVADSVIFLCQVFSLCVSCLSFTFPGFSANICDNRTRVVWLMGRILGLMVDIPFDR